MEEWIRKVRLREGFWKQQSDKNREITMRAVWDRFADTGRIGAFRCDWKEGMGHKPDVYWDSDVAKWMEAAAYLLGKEEIPDQRTAGMADRPDRGESGAMRLFLIFHILTWSLSEPLHGSGAHELYCADISWKRPPHTGSAAGETRFLNAMCRYADYIYEIFYVQKSAAFSVPGHEEIELALIRLYRVTGERRYLEAWPVFSEHQRDRAGPLTDRGQNHLPVRSQKNRAGALCPRTLSLFGDGGRRTGNGG